VFAGPALDAADVCTQQHVDALVSQQFEECRGDVRIFTSGELRTSFDDCYTRAEAASGLREL